MADTGGSIQESARAALQTLTALEQRLQATQQQVKGLGFIARGFVERDINSATGRGFGEWIAAAGRLKNSLLPLTSGPNGAAVTVARQTITDEQPRLAVLRGYLERAPERMNAVPAAVLKPQQRAEVLEQVSQQVKALQALEQQLSAVGQMLAQMS